MRFAQEQHARLIDAVDHSVRGDAAHGVAQASKGREEVRHVYDVLGVASGLDDTRPADPGVDADASLQVLALAAAVDPIGLTRGSEVLHEGPVVPHHHDDGVLGDAEPVHLVDDLSDPRVDLDDALGDGSPVESLELLHIGSRHGEGEERPVVQEEGLVLLRKEAELL